MHNNYIKQRYDMNLLWRSKQDGSTITFLIVGIILIISLVGAVYALRQRGDQVRREQAISNYDKQQSANKSSNKPVDINTDNTEKPSVIAGTAQELPTTGLTSSFIELFELGLLSMLIISYILSRRDLARYL